MKKTVTAALAMLSLCASAAALAADPMSPVGLWKTIDDKTGKPKSLMRLTEVNGVVQGKVEKIFREPTEDQNPMCDKCEGELKGKPVLGLTILTGLKKDGDEYTGGQIVDPNDGKVYKAKVTLIEGGRKLNMRGFIGFALLGRTQTWLREE